MADYRRRNDQGWRSDPRSGWNSDRSRGGHYGEGSDPQPFGEDDRFGRSRYEDYRGNFADRRRDMGTAPERGTGYSTPRPADEDFDQRRGLRDEQDWRATSRSGRGNRGGYSDYRGSYGAYPEDYQDYGDWQGEGDFAGYGGPRFGDNYGRERDAYGRGYRNYGTGNYGAGSYVGGSSHGAQNYALPGRGYTLTGPDYANAPETGRSFWDRAGDEVASWVGDRDAARRRDMDRMRSHAGRGPRGYVRSDDRIREDVNDRLTDDWQLDASNIEVAVTDGEVTLSGTVGSRADKHHAEHLVEDLPGVRHVQNNLRVDEHRGMGANPETSTPVGSSNTHTSLTAAQTSTGTSTGSGIGGNAQQRPAGGNNLNQTH
jgi:osmotically-inducible protein OsmY